MCNFTAAKLYILCMDGLEPFYGWTGAMKWCLCAWKKPMKQRKIIHVDMDAFYVSVEELDDPSLKGKPVVVGHDGPRGVVSTANYVARKYGIHSALPIAMAHRLCPKLVVVEPHFNRYKEVSRQVHEIFHEYTDLIEPLSLDEAYLDVTDNKRGMDMAVDIAREIKQKIRQVTGLTASAGVSYCKFLAKVASDFRKPDGLCTVHPERALDFIDNLKVEQLWGVGEKTAQHMHKMGVFTGKQLRGLTLQQLTTQFGKMGRVFYNFARGIDNRPVVTEWVRKSVGCERTYLKDLTSQEDMLAELDILADELEGRLARNSFKGRTLVLKVKFSDFQQTTHSITENIVIEHKDKIMVLAKALLDEVDFQQKSVRLLGITATNPVEEEMQRGPVQLYIEWPPFPQPDEDTTQVT